MVHTFCFAFSEPIRSQHQSPGEEARPLQLVSWVLTPEQPSCLLTLICKSAARGVAYKRRYSECSLSFL